MVSGLTLCTSAARFPCQTGSLGAPLPLGALLQGARGRAATAVADSLSITGLLLRRVFLIGYVIFIYVGHAFVSGSKDAL